MNSEQMLLSIKSQLCTLSTTFVPENKVFEAVYNETQTRSVAPVIVCEGEKGLAGDNALAGLGNPD